MLEIREKRKVDMYILTLMLHICLEMLPISSSTHVALLTGYDGTSWQALAAHGPAALVLAVYALPHGIEMLRDRAWGKIVEWCIAAGAADVVTTIGYLVLTMFDIHVFDAWVGMLVTALVLMYITLVHSRNGATHPHYAGALWVGAAQVVALLPGVSRLALTYAVGRMVGWRHRCAFIFTCAIAVPLYAGYWGYASLRYGVLMPLSGVSIALVSLSLIVAYGALYTTDYIFARGRAWYFSVYMAIMAGVVYAWPGDSYT